MHRPVLVYNENRLFFAYLMSINFLHNYWDLGKIIYQSLPHRAIIERCCRMKER
jgi:hypothetical protein